MGRGDNILTEAQHIFNTETGLETWKLNRGKRENEYNMVLNG
jgi:hypothetical protein